MFFPCKSRWLFGISVFTITLIVLSSSAFAGSTELFFSEYIEGSSYNKALEIYNGTGGTIDLGASSYNVEMYFNGSSSPGLTIALTGTIVDYDVFVLAHSSADSSILAQADQTYGSGWFNGDDAVVLKKGIDIIDVIGQIGFDPGSQWGAGLISTQDNTLRRKSNILAGDSNAYDAFDPALEWEGFDCNTFDGAGSHTTESQVPEPSSMLLLGFGLAGLLGIGRMSKK